MKKLQRDVTESDRLRFCEYLLKRVGKYVGKKFRGRKRGEVGWDMKEGEGMDGDGEYSMAFEEVK